LSVLCRDLANRRACSISCSSALRVMFFIRKQCTRYSCNQQASSFRQIWSPFMARTCPSRWERFGKELKTLKRHVSRTESTVRVFFLYVLITRRSSVQICPPQPFVSLATTA
jgi:hypothetical protein